MTSLLWVWKQLPTWQIKVSIVTTPWTICVSALPSATKFYSFFTSLAFTQTPLTVWSKLLSTDSLCWKELVWDFATTPHKQTGFRWCFQVSSELRFVLVRTWTSNLCLMLLGVYTLSNSTWLVWIFVLYYCKHPTGAWTCHAVPNTQRTQTAAPPFWPLLKTTLQKCLRFLSLTWYHHRLPRKW